MDSASTTEPNPERWDVPLVRLGRLAVGGMAEIFVAATPDGRRVVLKVPLPSGAASDDRAAALAHEARITAKLAHPNLVRTLGFREAEDASEPPSLVLEYVDGCTLAALLEDAATRGERLPVGVALRIVVDLARALAHAHDARDASGRALELVHRDVNPCNVLVGRDGRPKLTDFGIARSLGAQARTRTGTVKGTLRYLAPEQANGSAVDARTDVYALGLLAFELLAGEPYLDSDSELGLLRLAESPPARTLPDGVVVEPAVRKTLDAMLARFPEERPTRAESVAARLEPFAAPREEAEEALACVVRRVAPTTPFQEATAMRARTSATAEGAPHPAHAASSGEDASTPAVRRAGTRTAIVGFAIATTLGLTWLALGRPETERPTSEALGSAAAATERTRSPANASPSAPRGASDPATSAALAPPQAASAPTRASAPGTEAQRTAGRSTAGTRPSTTTPDRPTPQSAAVVTQAAAPSSEPNAGHATSAPQATSTEPRAAAPTRESVRAELARADAALRRARGLGLDVARAQGLSSSALEAYSEGRYDDASQLVRRVLSAIPDEGSGTPE